MRDVFILYITLKLFIKSNFSVGARVGLGNSNTRKSGQCPDQFSMKLLVLYNITWNIGPPEKCTFYSDHIYSGSGHQKTESGLLRSDSTASCINVVACTVGGWKQLVCMHAIERWCREVNSMYKLNTDTLQAFKLHRHSFTYPTAQDPKLRFQNCKRST